MDRRSSVRSKTISFIATQSLIMGVIMLAFVFLTSVLFVKNARRWELQNIEQDVLMFSRQAANAGEVPKRGDLGEYVFFIMDLSGQYILPRLPRSDESEVLWQKHELKLIYEMQKKRDGWAYYPERDRMDLLNEGQYVLRYVFLEQQGWIVAAEGYVPSAWGMLQGFLTPKLFLGLTLIVLAAFALMLVNAFWHFRRMMRAILRSQENNFIVAQQQPRPPEPTFIKAEDRGLSSGVLQNSRERVLPKMRQPPKQETSLRREPLSERVSDRRKEPFHLRSEEAGAVPNDVEENRDQEETSAFNPKAYDDLGEVVIDTAELRSPLLRKVIEEMRNGA